MNDSNLGRYTPFVKFVPDQQNGWVPWALEAISFPCQAAAFNSEEGFNDICRRCVCKIGVRIFFFHMYVFTAVYTPPRMKVDCWIKWTPLNLFHLVSCPKSLHWYRRHVFSKIQWDSSCHGFLCAGAHGRSPRRAGSDCRAAEGIEGNGREWSVLAIQPGNGQPAQCTGQSAKRGKLSWHEPLGWKDLRWDLQ